VWELLFWNWANLKMVFRQLEWTCTMADILISFTPLAAFGSDGVRFPGINCPHWRK